jgi:hypothetical protein
VGGAIAPAALEFVQKLSVGQQRQPLDNDGRTSGVAAQPLEAHPIVRRDADTCVKIETRNVRAPRTGGKILRLASIPDSEQAPAGIRPCRNPSLNRSTIEFGEKGLVPPERVGLLRIGVPAHAAIFEQLQNSIGDFRHHPGDFGSAGRRECPE